MFNLISKIPFWCNVDCRKQGLINQSILRYPWIGHYWASAWVPADVWPWGKLILLAEILTPNESSFAVLPALRSVLFWFVALFLNHMVGLSGQIVARIVLRVNATSGISAATTATKARKQARSCSTFFVGFLDVIAQLILPNLIEMAMRSPLHQWRSSRLRFHRKYPHRRSLFRNDTLKIS